MSPFLFTLFRILLVVSTFGAVAWKGPGQGFGLRTNPWYWIVVGFLALLSIGPSLLRQSTITNPFIDPLLFAGYLAALAAFSALVLMVRGLSWSFEKSKLQQTLAQHLGLPRGALERPECDERILALVPCRGRRMQGSLASLKGKRRLWLCFLADRLLVVSGGSGQVVELSQKELQKLHLVERLFGASFSLALKTEEGVSRFDLKRLDDMVRIVNILIRQGIVLGYLDEARRLRPWANLAAFGGVALLIAFVVNVIVYGPDLLSRLRQEGVERGGQNKNEIAPYQEDRP